MKNRIYTRNTKTQTGKPLRLEYCLLEDTPTEGYGVQITAICGEQTECARIPGITPLASRIFELLDLLASGTVTPTGLKEVVEDWL